MTRWRIRQEIALWIGGDTVVADIVYSEAAATAAYRADQIAELRRAAGELEDQLAAARDRTQGLARDLAAADQRILELRQGQ